MKRVSGQLAVRTTHGLSPSANGAEQDKIQVDTFTDIAFEGAWKGRARSFWATATVGTGVGAVMGAVVPFFPVLAGVPLAAAAATLPISIPIYAALGMSSGFAVGVLVGATSGATAAVAKEQERRDKGRDIEQVVRSLPGATLDAPPVAEAREKPRTIGQHLKNIKDNYINVPTLLAYAAIGAIGGLVMFAAFNAAGVGIGDSFLPIAKPIMGKLLGAAAGQSSAIAAYTVGVMATFGAIFGCNLPKIAGDTTRLFGDMLGGKTFGSQKGPAHEQARAPVFSQTFTDTPAVTAEQAEPERAANFRQQERSQSDYRELVTRRISESLEVSARR